MGTFEYVSELILVDGVSFVVVVSDYSSDPTYGASVVFELWNNTAGGLSVRMYYNQGLLAQSPFGCCRSRHGALATCCVRRHKCVCGVYAGCSHHAAWMHRFLSVIQVPGVRCCLIG
jgi:hypothetical protein